MRASTVRTAVVLRSLSVLVLGLAAACTLEPSGTDAEFERLSRAGGAWQQPPEQRSLPDLPADPTLDDIVARALLANGELEAAWQAWHAALERVLVASGWPNTDLAIGFTKFIEHGSGWDTSAVSAGFDPMQMLLLPDKVRQQGEGAFAEALAAGRRFEALRLSLRERAIGAWWEMALLGQRVRVQEQKVAWSDALRDSAAAGVAVGAAQQRLLQQQVDSNLARLELQTLRSQVPVQRAALNALLARGPEAPLPLPDMDALPAPRPLPSDDEILRAGVAANPALAEQAHLAEARVHAVQLAELRSWPNVAPSGQASGGSAESLGLMVTLPTTVPAVRAALRAARADLDESRAQLRQAEFDAQAQLFATLATLRNDDARLAQLRDEILPAAGALLDTASSAYATGRADFSALMEAREAALDVKLMQAETRAAREEHRAMLEHLAGTEWRTEAEAAPLAAGDQP